MTDNAYSDHQITHSSVIYRQLNQQPVNQRRNFENEVYIFLIHMAHCPLTVCHRLKVKARVRVNIVLNSLVKRVILRTEMRIQKQVNKSMSK